MLSPISDGCKVFVVMLLKPVLLACQANWTWTAEIRGRCFCCIVQCSWNFELTRSRRCEFVVASPEDSGTGLHVLMIRGDHVLAHSGEESMSGR
jgi:hypothetical protein